MKLLCQPIREKVVQDSKTHKEIASLARLVLVLVSASHVVQHIHPTLTLHVHLTHHAAGSTCG